MTPETEVRFGPLQGVAKGRAVAAVTGRAFAVVHGLVGKEADFFPDRFGMAAQTGFGHLIGEIGRVIAPVVTMTDPALSFCEGGMGCGGLLLFFSLMATSAKVPLLGWLSQQLGPLAAMRVMAGAAASFAKRTMEVETAHFRAGLSVTGKTKIRLVFS
jgi:hypothetical protein